MSQETQADMDHIEILRKEFNLREQKNARYSVRAFARLLGIDSSSLSAILRGKRPFPASLAEQVCSRLKLSDSEKKMFFRSVISKQSRWDRKFIDELFPIVQPPVPEEKLKK